MRCKDTDMWRSLIRVDNWNFSELQQSALIIVRAKDVIVEIDVVRRNLRIVI